MPVFECCQNDRLLQIFWVRSRSVVTFYACRSTAILCANPENVLGGPRVSGPSKSDGNPSTRRRRRK